VWEGIFLDVTDRWEAESALHRERELLGTIFERIPVMLTRYEPDTKLLRLNPAFEATTGWSAEEATGISLMEECYPDPAYRERVREFMQSCRDGWMDVRMRTRDGRDVETSWANVRLADGTQVGIGLDITERRAMEDALREADRRKDEFLALLGHELRNPLAPIRNALQILEVKGADPPTVARARAMIDRQATQLTRLVDELLDASRIARGKVRLTVEPLDLAALVRTAIGDHHSEAETAGLAVELAVPSAPVRVRGDPARLTQVVTNLWGNAVKFTPHGGRISIRLDAAGTEAVLSLSDTGIGIDPAAVPTLFQPFRQVDADPARTKGGLGLGLSVVRGLVELHGGRVEAASAGAGRGARFTVRLPLDSAEPAPGAAPPNAAARPVGVRRIVIVEDGEDAAESLRELLELKGFEAAVARTGADGVELCLRLRPDGVVCDLGLPAMTGFEVARALRADPATAGAVLVAVSGYAQDEDRRRATAAGFDALLAKPADTDELTRLLTRPRTQ
jgi:PAS domain S-box-containing protein